MNKLNRLGIGLMLLGNFLLTLAINSKEIYASSIVALSSFLLGGAGFILILSE